MKSKSIRIFALALALLLIPVSSCSDQPEKKAREWLVERDCAYFETKSLEIASSLGEKSIYTLGDVCSKEDQIAMLLVYSDIDTYEEKGAEIILLDPEGNVTDKFLFEEVAPGYSVMAMTYDLTGRLVVLGKTIEGDLKILAFSSSGTQIEEQIPVSGISFFISDMIPIETGWAFLGYDSIALTDKGGKVTYEQPLGGEAMQGGFFSEDGQVCALVSNGEGGDFSVLSIDPQSMSLDVKKAAELKWSDDLNLLYFDFKGGYASDNQGVYKFDFSGGIVSEIADWNRIDIPPSAYAGVQTKLYVLNDDTMLRNTQPMESRGNDELMILIHRDQDPNSNKKVLTIGGYDSRSDLLERAIYFYNTGDNDYRIELVEYWDVYPWVDAAGISQANAAIITDMSSGGGDDMFVGTMFDYDLWGDSGMVMDLSGLFGPESTLAYDDYLPCLTEQNKHNGKIYKIFPSFSVRGYAGYAESIGADNRLTLNRVSDIANGLNSSQMMFPSMSNSNLALETILYRLDDFIIDGEFSISEEDFLKIVEYADTYGYDENAGPQGQSSDLNLSYVTGQLLFQNAFIGSPNDYKNMEQLGNSEMHFYGFPSVYDSARVCMPGTVIAVSSGTEDPDACLDFIKILLSDEVQQYALDSGYSIPVSVDMFEKQISLAMTGENENSSDMSSANGKPMTEESVNQYRECIESLNCIYSLNIDLWIILYDEFGSYFTEGKSISDVRETVINRVNVYLDEKKG